jgi:hypothetical protein
MKNVEKKEMYEVRTIVQTGSWLLIWTTTGGLGKY